MEGRPLSPDPGLQARAPLVTVVVPVRDEEGSVGELVHRVGKTLDEAGVLWEILFVDDGSRDRTVERIFRLRAANDAVKLLRFTRSFGQQAALTAGLSHACGDAVITMDGDLQHPPEVLAELIDAWRGGADVVHAIPTSERGGRGRFRYVRARLFYRVMVALSAMPSGSEGADFRLLDRRVVDRFEALGERVVFVRALVPWLGFREERVVYQPADRLTGRTKYGLRKELLLAADGIFSFSMTPLHLIAGLGAAVGGLGLVATLALVTGWLLGAGEPSWMAAVLLAVLVLGGLQLLAIGVVGQYVGRTQEEVKGRPRYVIDDMLGIEPTPKEQLDVRERPPPG